MMIIVIIVVIVIMIIVTMIIFQKISGHWSRFSRTKDVRCHSSSSQVQPHITLVAFVSPVSTFLHTICAQDDLGEPASSKCSWGFCWEKVFSSLFVSFFTRGHPSEGTWSLIVSKAKEVQNLEVAVPYRVVLNLKKLDFWFNLSQLCPQQSWPVALVGPKDRASRNLGLHKTFRCHQLAFRAPVKSQHLIFNRAITTGSSKAPEWCLTRLQGRAPLKAGPSFLCSRVKNLINVRFSHIRNSRVKTCLY